MIPYTLHVALLITICLLFYKIFLRKETFFGLNRAMLITCLCLSFVMPLIPIPQQWAFTNNRQGVAEKNGAASDAQTNNTQAPVQPQSQPAATPQSATKAPLPSNDSYAAIDRQSARDRSISAISPSSRFMQQAMKWALYLYRTGVAVFGLSFLLQLAVLLFQAYTKPVVRDGRFRIVELTGDKAPCSFGNNIFINPSRYDWPTYSQILLHEKTHVQQGHSFDIIFAELTLIFQWFNPFAWLYRKEVENNLEFLTDKTVLAHEEVEQVSYQMSLLKVSTPHLSLGITTNYNQSLLKRRIAMMNAKKSNIHTMWKYFFLLPLLVGLACTLNNTVAYSQDKDSDAKKTNDAGHADRPGSKQWSNHFTGSWFATIKGDKIRVEFSGDDDEHNWSSSSDFLLSEFPSLPQNKTGEFTLQREAGTMVFNGKFEGDQGFGHYKFMPDKEFGSYLRRQGISETDEHDAFAFFMINVKKDYVEILKKHYKKLSKEELISAAALKIDAAYIDMWAATGYPDLSIHEMVSGKALGIDKAYVDEIKKAGYSDLSFNDLISFKAQHITGEYINSVRKARLKENNGGNSSNNNDLPPAHQLSAFKAMNIDSEYIRSLEELGYNNLPYTELTALKSLHVNADFIKSFGTIGYRQIPAHDLIALKSMKITPEFVKTYEDMGYRNIRVNELLMLKSMNITPEYINGFKKLGFTNVGLNEFAAVKSAGITPEYITDMQAKGFKSNDLNKYIRLKFDFGKNQ